MTVRRPGGPTKERTLLLVGNTLHVRDGQGRYCTHGALARQLDQWFAHFDHVVIAAVLDPEPEVPAGFAAYSPADITFVPLAKAGGVGLRAKLGALRSTTSWIRQLVPLLRRADVVHLRAPCNITVLAIPLSRMLSKARYAIYAGAWEPPPGGSRSYTLQRWMLRWFGGVVHVYAPASVTLGSNLRPNFSPTFSEAQIAELAGLVDRRLERIRSAPPSRGTGLRISCVGRFSENKNQAALVEAAAQLAEDGIHVEVRFAGSGETQHRARDLVAQLGVEDRVHFLGRLDQDDLVELWAWADVNATLTMVEGFGRVTLEAMAVGCPSLCGPGAMQGEMVGHGRRGWQLADPTAAMVAATLKGVLDLPVERWEQLTAACRAHASTQTIEAFGHEVDIVLGLLANR